MRFFEELAARLFQEGLISDPKGKRKSVDFSEAGQKKGIPSTEGLSGTFANSGFFLPEAQNDTPSSEVNDPNRTNFLEQFRS